MLLTPLVQRSMQILSHFIIPVCLLLCQDVTRARKLSSLVEDVQFVDLQQMAVVTISNFTSKCHPVHLSA